MPLRDAEPAAPGTSVLCSHQEHCWPPLCLPLVLSRYPVLDPHSQVKKQQHSPERIQLPPLGTSNGRATSQPAQTSDGVLSNCLMHRRQADRAPSPLSATHSGRIQLGPYDLLSAPTYPNS